MRYLLFLLLFISSSAIAKDFIIGFRGMNEQFDTESFIIFAQKRNLKPYVFSANQVSSAVRLIKSEKKNYELYGYSLGAVSVRETLTILKKENVHMPTFIITVGAYRTTNVNFKDFDVNFFNFFDDSGKGSLSPGLYIPVPHHQIMRYVTDMQIILCSC
jgi:hypothetical protein